MNKKTAVFTSGEFARLHHLNKRTLHYYDDIHLFSPQYKGENGYRYYTYEQSMELEHILALRELGMSIDEIKDYSQNPNPAAFLSLAETKSKEIDAMIERLKLLQTLFRRKTGMLAVSNTVHDQQIEIVTLGEESMLMTPLPLIFESDENLFQNARPIMDHLQKSWELCTYKQGCGSYLSVEKIKCGQVDEYDGIFTVISSGKKKKGLYHKPKGTYIRAFSIGSWDKIPALYEKILTFATDHNLTLGEYAFEIGLNEFAVSSPEDYVTQIELPCTADETPAYPHNR